MDKFYYRRFAVAAIAALVVVSAWLLLISSGKPAPKAEGDPTVKRLADDFRRMQVYVEGFRDRFRGALPGDFDKADALDCDPPCRKGNGDGVIEGVWNSTRATDESWLVWSHLHAAKLRHGPTTWVASVEMDPYIPKNAVGGRLGITSKTLTYMPISQMSNGNYFACSSRIPGKLAVQLDALMDDGDTAGGQMQIVAEGSDVRALPTRIRWWNGWWYNSKLFSVCMIF